MSVQTLKYTRTRPYPERKIKKIEELKRLLSEYKHILLLRIREVNANQMKELRRKVWGKGIVKVIKNTLAKVAIEQLGKPEIKKLLEYFEDMHALILTNDDPFELARIANSIREKRALKPGRISPVDVVIKKGFTGLRPGPEMSEMRMAGLPVRIFDGEVFVSQDHVLVKAGQAVSPYAARVMELLDIKPLEVGPEVIVGIVDGMVMPREVLLKSLEDYISEIQQAFNEVKTLALQGGVFVPELLDEFVGISVREVLGLVNRTGIIAEDTIQDAVKAGLGEIISLVNAIKDELPSIPEEIATLVVAQAPTQETKREEETKEEEKKEEKKEEEEAGLAGLSLLF